jgi:hypothetical protein
MRIETTEVDGWKTCAADRTQLEEDCPGYDSRPIRVIQEEIWRVFADHYGGPGASTAAGPAGGSTDPFGILPSDSRVNVKALDPADLTCEFCGHPATLSLEPRRAYMRLHEQSPDELVRRARTERKLGERQLTAAERQAQALERIASAPSAEVNALRDEVRALKEALEAQKPALPASEGESAPGPTPEPPRPQRARQRA